MNRFRRNDYFIQQHGIVWLNSRRNDVTKA